MIDNKSRLRKDGPMREDQVMACVAHIRAAAKLCETDGRLALWATLLGVSDQLLETLDEPALHRD